MIRKTYLLLIFFLFLQGCAEKLYRIDKNNYGEPLINTEANYTFNKVPNKEDLTKIDTAALYVQIFEGRYFNEDEMKNPRIIIFHNDGFFKNESYLYFGSFDNQRDKKSVYYGGKYMIDGDQISMEQFGKYPGYKKWDRRNSYGKIEGDKIIFKNTDIVTVFEKKSFKAVFGIN